MMRILLTGSNGFIGRNLAENLRLDHEVETPDREALTLRMCRQWKVILASIVLISSSMRQM